MNEQANIEVIRSTYAAFKTADLPAILSCIAEGAQWHNQGPETVPYAGLYRGKEEIVRFFQTIAESTTGGEVVVDDYVAQGDRVIAFGRYRATVRSTGAPIDSPIAHDFTLRDGRIVRWEGYSDTALVAAAHSGQSVAAGQSA
ncbi:MAG: nuclear transport factor 2 family protein [Candidatus Solibacter sp.]